MPTREEMLVHLTAPERRPALLVVDVQNSFADPELLASWGTPPEALELVASAVAGTDRLVGLARAAGVPVIWIELASDPARPWRASAWLRTGDPDTPYGPDEPCVAGTEGARWYGVEPGAGEARVAKRGYSGFHGTGLADLLHEQGIDWVTVAGLTTECCVAATAVDAFQHGYPVVVATDAVAAYDLEVQRAALNQLELTSAVLASSADLQRTWASWGAARLTGAHR